MLDGLKDSLGAAIKKIVKSSGIDEELIKELAKDVQRALLQSDVNVRLVLEITKNLEERALNETPPPGLSRKDHIVKILYDELSKLLGNESDFEFKPGRQNKIILLGIQGSGKTTVTAKLAKFLTRQGYKVGVVGADTYRPGALVQLKTMCEKSSVEVYGEENNKDSPNIVKNGLKHFAGQPLDAILIDTAGRHKEEKDLLEEMSRINKIAEPDLALLVIDGTIGAVLDGCSAGLEIDEKDIQKMLDQRKPGQNLISTQRKEGDVVEIISGVFRGYTTGAPITMMIWNSDQKSKDYENLKTKLRPGHSDYPAMVKYNHYNDYRGGGRFSGRLTATHVMGGAIARKLLKVTLKIETNSYTSQIGKVKMEREFNEKMINSIYKNEVRCPENKTAKMMRTSILNARKKGDSLGGIIESVTTNVPVGLGEPIFSSLESDLSKAIFSIPSVKGVEFGSGFRGSELHGSENNDLYTIKKGKIVTKTNNSGGILGGISNGMPITMRIAFKPASSIAQKQSTVDIKTKKVTTLQVKGRHDPCVVPRAPPVVDALVALTIADHALLAGTIKPVL